MTPSRAEKLRPEALSLAEVLHCVRTLRTQRRVRRSDLRRELVAWRRFDLPDTGWLSTSEAGFFLVRSRHTVGDYIRAGRLPAREVERRDGRGYAYRVRVEDLRELLALELERAA